MEDIEWLEVHEAQAAGNVVRSVGCEASARIKRGVCRRVMHLHEGATAVFEWAAQPKLSALPLIPSLLPQIDGSVMAAGLVPVVPALTIEGGQTLDDGEPRHLSPPSRISSINRPEPGGGEFDEVAIRIAEIDALPAARPIGAPFDFDPVRLEPFLPDVKLVRARSAKAKCNGPAPSCPGMVPPPGIAAGCSRGAPLEDQQHAMRPATS